jgi:type I restriction enzyme S subunit
MSSVPFHEALEDCSRLAGKIPQSSCLLEGEIPVIGQGRQAIEGFTNDSGLAFRGRLPVILFGDHTAVFKFIDYPFARGADGTKLFRPRSDHLDPRYAWHFLQTVKLPQTGYDRKTKYLESISIPLPSLEEQRRIAAILDARKHLEAKILKRHALLDELSKAEFIKRFGNPFAHKPQHPMVRLSKIASTSSGGTPKREVREYFGGSIPWVKSGELSNPVIEATEEFLTEDGLRNSSARMLSPGVVLLSMYGATAGAVSILGVPACTNQAVCAIDTDGGVDSIFLADYLRLIAPDLLAKRIGGAQPNLTQDIIRNILVPAPRKAEQESYVLFRKKIANAAIGFSKSSMVVSRLDSSCSRAVFQ